MFNKHQIKNRKTNFLQAKSSREQFQIVRHSAALPCRAVQANSLSDVGASLIKQIFHSQRNFRPWNSYYLKAAAPHSQLSSDQGTGKTRTE